MSWFKRVKEGIQTRTEDKSEVPEGLWSKCPSCKSTMTKRSLEDHQFTCPECNYHFRIGSNEYFNILFDGDEYDELDPEMISSNPLNFTDTSDYASRLRSAKEKTGLNDAIRVAFGNVDNENLVIACMDFTFIGGSMGSVMGQKIADGIDYCVENNVPMLIISKSGGARMMEGAFSLMQMAKVSAKLNQLAEKKIPYFSLMTDPTTGGVTASFAMLGDLNFAEPKALIGFAGPRVIKETIGKDLPEGFQRSEFVLEHGFLDFIINRQELKSKLGNLIRMFRN